MQILRTPTSCSTWFVLIILPLIAAQTISLGSDSAILQQRDCVQYCIGTSGYLVETLGCSKARLDSCLCRADLRPGASSYITYCLSTRSCANPTDYNAAVSIYNRYCTFTEPATVTATPTSGSDNTAANGLVTVTVTSTGPTVKVTSTGPTVKIATSTSSHTTPPTLGELLHLAGWTVLLFLGVIAIPRR
jgi:hypothetical protein